MILPSRKLLVLLAVPTAALLLLPSTATLIFAVVFDAGLLLLALLDMAISPRPHDIQITRRLPQHLHLGAVNSLGWDVRNGSRYVLRFTLIEDLPEAIETTDLPMTGQLAPHATAELRYKATPTARGKYTFGNIHLRYMTVLGLLVRQVRIAAATDAKVYPNVQALARYELAAQRQKLAELGLTASRMRGKGRSFESLRDYVPGDDPVDVAWKASARRGRLTTRNYEVDRSQNILIVLDCGRLMTTRVDHLSRLDHAINASILLTYVAIKQSDYVGLVAFSSEVHSYVPLTKGRAALSRMNEALYTLEPQMRESDYDRACRFLALQSRKRSLIVILTDVVDSETSSPLITHAARFARRHLPLVVTLRNLEIEAVAERAAESAAHLFQQSIAVQMLEDRSFALGRMRRSGVDVLDADPRHLTPRLLDRYLTLKQRMRV